MPVITKPNQHFDASLYTGNGTGITVTNSGSMQPDLVWIKAKNAAYNHGLVDSVRGINKHLFSNMTNLEGTCTAGKGITALNSNGFTLGTESDTNAPMNENGVTFAAWQWKAGGAATTIAVGQYSTSPNVPSIASSVSANPTAGFSVFTFNSGASGTQTVGHGLGAYPGMVIFKDRGVAGYWSVWHSALSNPAQSYMYLDLTNAEGADASQWSNTAPTSSVFTYNSGYSFNTNRNMLAYALAPVAGYSAFGKYTSNNSTDGPFIYTGFRPRFLMIKKATGSVNANAGWYIYDTARGTINVMGPTLRAELPDAESTFNSIDFLSNGFKIRALDIGINSSTSGDTYIYMAFAEAPFKYSSAR